MSNSVKVLLIDDSFVIRAALKRLLEKDSDIEVIATASNGAIGVSEAEKHKPDVIILDIEMPIMDGLTALPQILQKSPQSKVIMFSTLTEKGAAVTMKALSLGAAECLVKPSSQDPVDIGSDFEMRLTSFVKALGMRKAIASPSSNLPSSSSLPERKKLVLNTNPMAYKGAPAIIAIGSSTGGPNALFEVCRHFKGISVPVIITQHMPKTFTKMLASHIQEKTGVPCHEGAEGMIIEKGNIYVAPGGFHMTFQRKEDQSIQIRLHDTAPINYCKPSVDPMMQSAVELYGHRVLGVILTGMGSDGIGGGEAIVKNNGRLIAQDEATCTVWGMPRAVSEAGYCTQILPLQEIGPWIRQQSP
jgi:two-component system chemotaxis response regulator CheB